MTTHDVIGNADAGGPNLVGLWNMTDPAAGLTSEDEAGGIGHPLHATGDVQWISGPVVGGAVQLDGSTASLGTAVPVLNTERSFSVAVWVRLDSALIGPQLTLPDGQYAVTVVAQEGPSIDAPTHCVFYLGARILEDQAPDGTRTRRLHWCLNVAPSDGSQEQRAFEWTKAFSSRPIGVAEADCWTLLVGVVDHGHSLARLYVRSNVGVDEGEGILPDLWPHWQADGAFRVGRALWLGNSVDYWPGAIGPVRAYSGVLTSADVTSLFDQATKTGT